MDDTEPGVVNILSVGEGHIKLSFDKNEPAERIRAARIVKDMLKRGYALLVDKGNGQYQRAEGFDEETCEYILADFDPVEAEKADAAEAVEVSTIDRGTAPPSGTPSIIKPRGKRQLRIPADKAHVNAIGRIAGG